MDGEGRTSRREPMDRAAAAGGRAGSDELDAQPASHPWTPEEEPALTARSVVASTLLGARPPRLPTRTLVGACALFGIADGTARVAISRMVGAGELAADDGGYRLVGPLLDRSARQDLSAAAATLPWRIGDPWAMAVVVGDARRAADRAALRQAATTARLAELREGVWLRPANLPATDPAAEAVLDAQCRRMAAHPAGDLVELAAELWDLAGWAERARRLVAALARTRSGLDDRRPTALPEAFVLSAAVLRHLQSDPLLPPDLLPPGWPGPDLRAVHADWRTAFDRTWAGWARGAASADMS